MSAQFTKEQLRDYKDFERVRNGGKFNMLDPRARSATKLDREDYLFVMRNYSALREASDAATKATGAA